MSDPDDDLPPAKGGERTVMVSAEDLARLHGDAPPPPADPFAVPSADPFGTGAPDPFAAPPADAIGTAVDPFAASQPAGAFAASQPPSDPFAAPSAISAPPASVPPPPPVAAMLHGTPGALVGIQLNDLFEIVRFIAQGGMGEVYEGRNLASGERVAIKVILPQYAADEQFMALFRREASALERIGHDSLVKYRTLAFDRTNRVNYLAIEYVAGPSMAEILVGDPADPAVVRRVLKRLATGLGAAHDAGVIHRDLSPDNLLLPDGNVERCKIIDFGIAKDTNPGEKSVVGEAFAGKFGYAAPEIFGKYKRSVGPWTDVYSLALVMIAFARGAPLDMGVTIVDALEARDTVPDLSSISPDLQPVFARMLAPDPAERFRSMDEVIAALDGRPAADPVAIGSSLGASSAARLEAAAAPAFVRATTAAPAPVREAEKPSSRTPLFAGIGVAVLLVAGGGAYLALGGKKSSDVPATPTTAAATTTAAQAPDSAGGAAPTAATSAAPDWATAKPAVAAALAAVSCSDLRIDGTPSGGVVRLAGWHPMGVSVPASAGGFKLDGSATTAVATPSPATCALLGKIRAAVPGAGATGFTMPADQAVSLSTAPKGPDGAPQVDLRLAGQPSGLGKLRVTTIEDSGVSSAKDWASSGEASADDLRKLGFDPKPSRFLAVVIASAASLPPITRDGADGVAAKCGGNRCAMNSGWIEITR
ncbi:MAG: serine/threonine protein kinase [Sphingomonadaceae bacterium]|nr:serine/threonine protein kinase [Sphingomonadaceae bacterium]